MSQQNTLDTTNHGKIIVITGASKGLGKAIAKQFAAAGYTLLVCARGELQLYKMMEELLLEFPNCTIKALPVDMGVKEEVLAFAKWCLQYGTPAIIVNNAGQFLSGTIHNEEEGLLEQMIQTNLYSAYYLTRALLPTMIARKSGSIFNICSIASLQAYTNGGSYSISKYALLGFSKNLREELKLHGIKVSAVMPGAAYTDSWVGSGVAESRIMQANDVAKMVFAASQLSAQAVMEDIVLRPQLGDL
ncbi:MAG: SDR family oxidoreductase [Flavobacterium sp.]|nr:SDR family oxidoreductase [Flavobacterium sp.]